MEVRDALDAQQCFALRATRSEVLLAREEVELDLDVAFVAIASGSVPRPFLATSPNASLPLAGYEDLSPLFQEWVTTARRSTQERLAAAFRRSYEDPAISRLLAESLQRHPAPRPVGRGGLQSRYETGRRGWRNRRRPPRI